QKPTPASSARAEPTAQMTTVEAASAATTASGAANHSLPRPPTIALIQRPPWPRIAHTARDCIALARARGYRHDVRLSRLSRLALSGKAARTGERPCLHR